jgi:hypothetical protein
MKTHVIFLAGLMPLILAGCKTTEPEVTKPISWEEQQMYVKRVTDPRIFGLNIYETPAGPQIRGGGRLHPEKAVALPMTVDAPLRPVVNLHGNFGVQWPVLLDLTSAYSYFEFNTARKIGARPIGEQGKAQLIQRPGDETASCLSLIPSLRLGQLFVENPLVSVRLANGPLGSIARGIEEPVLRGVVGWNVLEKLEQIQFLYSVGQIVLKTTEPYVPNPGLLMAELPLVKHAGACAVRGSVNGKRSLILIDPAGNFEVAADGTVSSLTLGSGLTVSSPVVSPSPGGVRIGACWLQNYRVTVCPQAGVVYFETRMDVED